MYLMNHTRNAQKKHSSRAGGRGIPWRDLAKALHFLRPYLPAATGALVALLMVTAGALITPQFIRVLIDRGIAGREWRWVVVAAMGLLAVALARGVFSFLQGYLSERTGQGVAFDLRNLIYEKIQVLSYSYHDRAQTGQLMTRVTSDVENVREFVGQGFLTFISATLTLVGTTVVLFVLDWRLALVALLVVPSIMFVIGLFVTRVIPVFREVQSCLGGLNSVLQENMAGVAVVKAFAREPYERERYSAANEGLLDANLRVVRALAGSFPTIFLLANLGTLGIVWIGGGFVIGGTLTLGSLVAFNTYLSFLLMPVFQLGFISAQMSRAGASAGRVFEVLETVNEVEDRPGAKVLEKVAGEVVFDRVSFRYAGQEVNTLENVSFRVAPGETVAVLGATGSGKSTVINLIPRFYDVTDGALLIDGVDVRDVTLESLRSHIGIVLQESTLFGGTIRENIAYGRPQATLEEVEAAARAAQAHDFITELPLRYESVVGERGVTLSGGQRQRIAIARTLLLDPRILLLDDAMSSVDSETEFRLQMALLDLMSNRTSFVIAQRLSTVRHADRILLLDEGRLIAEGTHGELLATSCLYAEIVSGQMAGEGRLS